MTHETLLHGVGFTFHHVGNTLYGVGYTLEDFGNPFYDLEYTFIEDVYMCVDVGNISYEGINGIVEEWIGLI